MERILTLHPEGKNGVNIELLKYTMVKDAIVKVLSNQSNLTFTALNKGCHDLLSSHFEGNIGWYVITVQKDLEARGILKSEKVKGKMLLSLS